MNQEQINEIKRQLWDYMRYLNSKLEEWKNEIVFYRYNGLVIEKHFCETEIEYWKGVKVDV